MTENPAVSLASQWAMKQFAQNEPTVLLPAHDPEAPKRLADGLTMNPRPGANRERGGPRKRLPKSPFRGLSLHLLPKSTNEGSASVPSTSSDQAWPGSGTGLFLCNISTGLRHLYQSLLARMFSTLLHKRPCGTGDIERAWVISEDNYGTILGST